MKQNINKAGLKWSHLRHVYVRKEEISQTLSRKSMHWGTFLKPVCINTGNKHGELEIGVQLQGHNPVGITQIRWDGSHSWSAAVGRDKPFKRNSQEAGHKKPRWFLECVNNSFLTQRIEEPLRRGALLEGEVNEHLVYVTV